MKSGLWSRILGTAFLSFQLLGSWAQAADVQRGTDVQKDDDTGMHLSLVPDRRYFVRFGAAYISPKDKASDVQDTNGPVIPYNIKQLTQTIPTSEVPRTNLGNLAYNTGINALDSAIQSTPETANYGIGVPPGISQKAKGGGQTVFLSLGMYLDDEQKWSAESFVLGAPIKLQAVGTGAIGPATGPYIVDKAAGGPLADPSGNNVPGNVADLGVVGSTKLLPLTVIFNRHFGDKGDKFRPSAGIVMGYNIFMETQASDALAAFSGGPTKVKLKNAPFIGLLAGGDYKLDDRWTLNAQIGYQTSRTVGTITTHAYADQLGKSPVAFILPGQVQEAATSQYGLPFSSYVYRVACYAKTGDQNDCGVYTRRFNYRTDALIFFVSMSYAF